MALKELNKTKNKIKLTFVLYLFCYLFAPPVLPRINLIIVVAAYSLIMIMVKYKTQIADIFKYSKMNKFILLTIVAYMYIALTIYIGVLTDPVNTTNYLKTGYRFMLLTPITLVCILYIILRCKELNYQLKDLLKAIIYAGTIQAIISTLMAISPQIKNLILKIVYFNTGDSLSQNLWHIQRRYFAFSQNVLDTFGYGTGIIAILPIFYGLYKSRYIYFVFTPILLIVPILNSRTGLIIAFLGICTFIIYLVLNKNIKQIIRILIITSIVIFVGLNLLKYLNEYLPITMEWVESGIDDTIAFLKGEEGADSVSVITSEAKWYVSESVLQILFGSGHTIFEASNYFHSDVGYVNDFWLGGMIGIFIMYLPLIYLFYNSLFKQKNLINKMLTLFLIISFVVANIKTIVYSYNVGTSLLLMLMFFMVYYENKKYNYLK